MEEEKEENLSLLKSADKTWSTPNQSKDSGAWCGQCIYLFETRWQQLASGAGSVSLWGSMVAVGSELAAFAFLENHPWVNFVTLFT